MAPIQLQPEYGYVIAVAGVLALEMMVIGGGVAGKRSKYFGKEFKERPGVKALEEEHKKAFPGQPFCPNGYPDMGNGKFAQHLTYAEWFDFNNAQRAHYNTVEQMPYIFGTMLAAGVVHPKTAAALGLVYAFGRAVFVTGYRMAGPSGRMIGSLIGHIGDFGLMGVCIRAGLKAAGAL